VFAAADGHASEPLKEFAGHLRAMPEILRANLYSTDRRIVWSSDQALTGRRFENNPELEQALSGTLVNEVSRLGNDKPEHVALAAGATGYFIEAYLPMWRDGKVIGVVELYKMPTALEAAISRGNRIIEGSAALAGLVLFATLDAERSRFSDNRPSCSAWMRLPRSARWRAPSRTACAIRSRAFAAPPNCCGLNTRTPSRRRMTLSARSTA
jgi:hypothetical protein